MILFERMFDWQKLPKRGYDLKVSRIGSGGKGITLVQRIMGK